MYVKIEFDPMWLKRLEITNTTAINMINADFQDCFFQVTFIEEDGISCLFYVGEEIFDDVESSVYNACYEEGWNRCIKNVYQIKNK